MTRILRTGAEHAAQILTAFVALQEAGGEDVEKSGVDSKAVDLVRESQALMAKFPRQARVQFVATLPFTQLEWALIEQAGLDDRQTRDALVRRLSEWASRSPVLVDEAPVHAAAFLEALTPHLATWEQRKLAEKLGARLVDV